MKTFSEFINEAKGYEDHEVSMIRAQIHSIKNSCETLMSHMQGEERDIEAWVQAKITRAEEELHAAANYIDSGESVSESAVPEKPRERLKTDRDMFNIPKSEQDAARQRALEKAAAMRAKKGITKET